MTLSDIENLSLSLPALMVCTHCDLALPYDARGHDGHYSCECGGDFCGCPFCVLTWIETRDFIRV